VSQESACILSVFDTTSNINLIFHSQNFISGVGGGGEREITIQIILTNDLTLDTVCVYIYIVLIPCFSKKE
jgi:hypothetical protein